MGTIWSNQVKKKSPPSIEDFEQARVSGFGMIELRAATRHGDTFAEDDYMIDKEARRRLRSLSSEYGIRLAYHGPQGKRGALRHFKIEP